MANCPNIMTVIMEKLETHEVEKHKQGGIGKTDGRRKSENQGELL